MKTRDDGTKLVALRSEYARLLEEVKQRIRTAQVKATFAANREMLALYWDVGRMIDLRQQNEGWGAAVIPKLARDIRNELPAVKGFSERNIGRMIAFYREYPGLAAVLPTALAKLPHTVPASEILPTALARMPGSGDAADKGQRLVAQLPWAHNVLLMQKVKDLSTRCWYMLATLHEGWSHDVLNLMIDSRAHERQGKAVSNFAEQFPPAQSDLVQQTLKDPYIFDFLTLEEPFHERELETTLVRHLEKFLVELGQGFAFVGRQVHMDVGEEDFYIDLLFYHLRLRSFVVIELKKGAFKPEYAGKLNFYLNVVDDRLRHPSDNPSIGMILCQNKNRLVAEYALKGMRKAIGVSEYQLTRALPKEFQSCLPSVAEIEAELSRVDATSPSRSRKRSAAGTPRLPPRPRDRRATRKPS
jgi:predicted nuclease of restriction endonuclease-like (RecB) superfamily